VGRAAADRRIRHRRTARHVVSAGGIRPGACPGLCADRPRSGRRDRAAVAALPHDGRPPVVRRTESAGGRLVPCGDMPALPQRRSGHGVAGAGRHDSPSRRRRPVGHRRPEQRRRIRPRALPRSAGAGRAHAAVERPLGHGHPSAERSDGHEVSRQPGVDESGPLAVSGVRQKS